MVQVSGSISLELILVMYVKAAKIHHLIPNLICGTSKGKPYNNTHQIVLYLIRRSTEYLMHSFMCLKKLKSANSAFLKSMAK